MTNINELLNEANELVPRISFEDAKAILDDPNTIISVSYTHLTLPTILLV